MGGNERHELRRRHDVHREWDACKKVSVVAMEDSCFSLLEVCCPPVAREGVACFLCVSIELPPGAWPRMLFATLALLPSRIVNGMETRPDAEATAAFLQAARTAPLAARWDDLNTPEGVPG
jgi:hypothetical protein